MYLKDLSIIHGYFTYAIRAHATTLGPIWVEHNVRIINPPFIILSIRLIFPNLGTLIN